MLEYPDQIALLKGSIFEAMLIRNSCGFHHLRRDINKSAILEEVGKEKKIVYLDAQYEVIADPIM